MIKKHYGTPNGKPAKINTSNHSSHKRKNLQQVLELSSTQKRNRRVAIKYKPIVKKIGKNYIEMTQLTDFEPVVLNVSPTLKIHRVSPRIKKIAELMQRSPVASIRRIGYDIIDI